VAAGEGVQHEAPEREAQLQRLSVGCCFADPPTAYFFVSPQGETSRYPPSAEGGKPGPLEWAVSVLARPSLKQALDRVWAGEEVVLAPAWYSPADGIVTLESGGATFPAAAQQRWLSIAFLPVRRQGTSVTDVCVRVLDETDKRLRTEEQRWQDQQNCRDLLAEALSHDLNNQLSVILAQASALRLATPPGELPAPGLGAIMDAVQRAASLLRAAAGLQARPAAARQVVDLNSILPDCAALLAHMSKGRVDVGAELGTGVPAVLGEEELLRTMILSLGRHVQALLPAGGRLCLRTFRQPSAGAGMPESAGLSIGDESVAGAAGHTESLEDTALSSDVALARAIVRVHRGHCGSTSSGTRGASWEVVLPGITEPVRAQAVPVPQTPTKPAIAPLPQARPAGTTGAQPTAADGQPCKILIAEDEENFRVFMVWALREHGYEVITAKDGQEALECFQESPESFSLAILDAYMPRMGGLEAYLRMQVLRPELPVLFASGFTRGASVDVLVAGCPGPASVLLKPFSATELIAAVQKAVAPR